MSIAPFTRIVNPCKTLVYSFAGQMDTSPSPARRRSGDALLNRRWVVCARRIITNGHVIP